MDFEILGEIRDIEVIAKGKAVRIRRRLNLLFGRGNWRKMKGIATVRDIGLEVLDAEIHWYEAHGIGRRDFKIKEDES